MQGGLYGSDILESGIADSNWMGYDTDYRDVFKEVISEHFGGSGAAVFPEPQVVNTTLEFV